MQLKIIFIAHGLFSQRYNDEQEKIKYINKDESYYCFLRYVWYNEFSKCNFKDLILSYWKYSGVEILDYNIDGSNTINGNSNDIIITNKTIDAANVYKEASNKNTENKIKNIKEADLSINTEENRIDNEVRENIHKKLKILKTYSIEEKDLTVEFIQKYGNNQAMINYSNREYIKANGVDAFKEMLVNNYKNCSSEYTTLNTKYNRSNYLEVMAAIDILEIMIGGKSELERFLRFKGKMKTRDFGQVKLDFYNRLSKVEEMMKNNYPETLKFRHSLMNTDKRYKLRVLNSIVYKAIDTKIIASYRNTYYKPVLMGYIPRADS